MYVIVIVLRKIITSTDSLKFILNETENGAENWKKNLTEHLIFTNQLNIKISGHGDNKLWISSRLDSFIQKYVRTDGITSSLLPTLA